MVSPTATRFVRITALVFCLLALFYACSNHNSPTKSSSINPPVDTTHPPQPAALYVEVGKSGNGSADNPFGSIQAAIDSAAHDSTIRNLFVAKGTYHESVQIHHPINLVGGCDPNNAWAVQSDSPSTVQSSATSPTEHPMTVDSANGTVQLSHFIVRASDAIDSGGNSIAVYLHAVDTVILSKCDVVAGSAMRGRIGTTGISGRNGDNGYYSSPGLLPVKGGKGGHYGIIGQFIAAVGDQGYCADGSQTGGLAATLTNWKSGDGQSGENGQDGAAGRYGLIARTVGDQLQFSAQDGDSGTTGGFGCGGGGGCGSNGRMDRDGPIPGCDGGGGGAGAAPGAGGTGGGAGGSSVGIFCAHCTLILDSTAVWSAAAGDGGSGGIGGKGGAGGRGEIAPCVAGMTGSDGGAGGNGGDGGNGGGGAGGWSIAVLLHQNQGNGLDTSACVVHLGQPGSGGSQGQGNGAGANGESVRFLKF